MSKEELFAALEKAILDGDAEAARAAAEDVLASGIDPLEAIEQGAMKGLDLLGERYQRLEAFLPELYWGGEAMKACTAILKSHIEQEGMDKLSLGKVVIGSIFGDVHDIGKNLVATTLSVNRFDVLDLGVNVPVNQFIHKAEEIGANVIAISALLTTTAFYQRELIQNLKEIGLRGKYYVVVGGAPITPQWATQIGADGYGQTAIDGVQCCKRLVSEGVPPPLPQPIIVRQ
ncbi:MAG: cobalamin B12-binding domain-containing protein [Chloroflexi bacterium]|nr:cobalamin B12-binding domain-containing protein [Chloroflexota bacterium]